MDRSRPDRLTQEPTDLQEADQTHPEAGPKRAAAAGRIPAVSPSLWAAVPMLGLAVPDELALSFLGLPWRLCPGSTRTRKARAGESGKPQMMPSTTHSPDAKMRTSTRSYARAAALS